MKRLVSTLSAAMILAALACSPDRPPLSEETLEATHQELKASGAKRWMVSCPGGCDEDVLRDAVDERGGSHGPNFGDRRGIVAVMDDAAAEQMRGSGFRLEEDKMVSLGKPTPPPPPQTTPWGVLKIGADAAWGSTTGGGVKVAVIDTGVSRSHPDLAANLDPLCANFTTERDCNDNNGHGSHVAGTIAAVNNSIQVVGVAHGARLYACKALNRGGSGYFSWIIGCIDWARLNGMHVINMSLGASSGTASLEAACDAADAAGTLVVAAAGNEGPGMTSYPAAYGSVVSVGATDSSDAVAYFSNTNSDVEWSAPGVAILSTWKGSGTNTISGTSMASPHAAGTAALVKAANPALTNGCVRSLVSATAVDLGTPGHDASYGNGRLNAAAAVSAAPSYPCP
jgi:subtilisin family serine protease